MRETRVQSLGWEDTLEKAMAPHSSILAWRIPSTEEPGGLQSTGLQRVRHDWTTSLSSGGLVFQLVCRFHRYWAYSSKSTVQLKMESRFQDRACSASSFTTTKGLHAATKTRCKSNKQIKINERFSWWLSVKRICLSRQWTPVRSLAWEDPTCLGAFKPMSQDYWACALEAGSYSYWAHVLQLLKPTCPRARAPQQWEALKEE